MGLVIPYILDPFHPKSAQFFCVGLLTLVMDSEVVLRKSNVSELVFGTPEARQGCLSFIYLRIQSHKAVGSHRNILHNIFNTRGNQGPMFTPSAPPTLWGS